MPIQAKRTARNAGAKPESLSEGPYDTTGHTPPARISNSELSRFVEFVERLEDETERALARPSVSSVHVLRLSPLLGHGCLATQEVEER